MTEINKLPGMGVVSAADLDRLQRSVVPMDYYISGNNYVTSKISLYDLATLVDRGYIEDADLAYIYSRNKFNGWGYSIDFLDNAIEALKEPDVNSNGILCVGDYFEVDDRKWRIVDINYFLDRNRDTNNSGIRWGTQQPHYVIMPDEPTSIQQLHNTNSTTSGFAGYTWTTSGYNTDLAIARNVFGNHIIPFNFNMSNSIDSNGNIAGRISKENIYISVPSVAQLYSYNSISDKSSNAARFCIDTKPIQFALFDLAPEFIQSSEVYWASDAWNTASNIFIRTTGITSAAATNSTDIGIRPYFLIG